MASLLRLNRTIAECFPSREVLAVILGLDNTVKSLIEWKKRYEKEMVFDIQRIFQNQGISYVKTNVELHKIDKNGGHPLELGDYDILAIDDSKLKIWIIESKVLKKVGSFFVAPNFDKTVLNVIPKELLLLLEKANIKVLSFGRGEYSAMAGSIKINGHTIGEIKFTNNDISRIAHNILHEIGHRIYVEHLSDAQRKQADTFENPISFYVQSLINGINTSGETNPYSALFHRNSASNPIISFVWAFICG